MNESERYLIMSNTARQLDSLPRPTGLFTVYLESLAELERNMTAHPKTSSRTIRAEYGSLPIPRVSKTALFVSDFPMQAIVDYSLQALVAHDLNGFIFDADIATGMGIVTGGVVAIEARLEKKTEDAIKAMSEGLSSEGIEFGTLDAVEVFLNIEGLFKRNPDLFSGSELRDPTGFELVDWIVQFLTEELGKPPTQRPPYLPLTQDATFIIKGAEMAARLYKFAYQLAE